MRGFCYLLATGQISPWHKTRDLVDSPVYRAIWDMAGPIVAILRARENPDWLRRLWGIPKDGKWHPFERDGLWQGVRINVTRFRTSYDYDLIERVGYEQRQLAPNLFDTEAACNLRCMSLNQGKASGIVDMRNSFRPLETDHPDLIVIDDPCEFSKYGSASDEFPA